MKDFTIQTTNTGETLFKGRYASFKDCLEDAVRKRTKLPYADLRGLNLSNYNLDDAILPHADFSHSNLTGANISESYLKGAKFDNAALYNTCFAYSNMTACNFQTAHFGATDICGAVISRAEFSTLSCFSLDFENARQMDNCIFISRAGHISQMSRPPIVIRGMGTAPIILTDNAVHSGHNRIDLKKCEKLAERLSMREIRRRLNVA